MSDAVYFVTWRLHRTQPEISPRERDLVLDAVRFHDGARYDLFAAVVMNDHVHVLLDVRPEHDLRAIVTTWKSFTANRLQRLGRRTGPIWQPESFDRIVRDEDELSIKLRYVAGNPFKRWPELESYRWLWITDDWSDLVPVPVFVGRASLPDSSLPVLQDSVPMDMGRRVGQGRPTYKDGDDGNDSIVVSKDGDDGNESIVVSKDGDDGNESIVVSKDGDDARVVGNSVGDGGRS